MRQITYQAKMEALELYLKGFSANEVVAKTGISKGAVISIIKDAREGKFPQLELKDRVDELHSLSVRLIKGELDLGQAKLGFTFLRRLLEAGIEPDQIKAWIEFCSEISPSPPEGFIPAAMEFFHVEKETGMSFAEIATKVKELSAQRENLAEEVRDLNAKEARAKELGVEIEKNQEKAVGLGSELANLEARTGYLQGLLQKRADELGIPHDDLVTKLAEVVSVEAEIVSRRQEKSKLDGEIQFGLKIAGVGQFALYFFGGNLSAQFYQVCIGKTSLGLDLFQLIKSPKVNLKRNYFCLLLVPLSCCGHDISSYIR